MSEPESKRSGSNETGSRSKPEDKAQRNGHADAGAPVSPLTLQVRKVGCFDFSKILNLRYKPE